MSIYKISKLHIFLYECVQMLCLNGYDHIINFPSEISIIRKSEISRFLYQERTTQFKQCNLL